MSSRMGMDARWQPYDGLHSGDSCNETLHVVYFSTTLPHFQFQPHRPDRPKPTSPVSPPAAQKKTQIAHRPPKRTQGPPRGPPRSDPKRPRQVGGGPGGEQQLHREEVSRATGHAQRGGALRTDVVLWAVGWVGVGWGGLGWVGGGRGWRLGLGGGGCLVGVSWGGQGGVVWGELELELGNPGCWKDLAARLDQKEILSRVIHVKGWTIQG